MSEVTSYPDPTESDLADPEFNAIWQAIKDWDLSREPASHRVYSGATGNDVMHVLLALRASHPRAEPSDGERAGDGRAHRSCPNCGPYSRFDEDGCCGTCGADTVLVPASSVRTEQAPTFEQVWAQKEREGYSYGEDALEQVRFGWELAQKAGVRAEQGGAWVACSERIPDPYHSVLAVDAARNAPFKVCPDQFVAHVDGGEWRVMASASSVEVTHWMTLPSSPATNGGRK